MKIVRIKVGEGDQEEIMICSYNFQLFEIIFKYTYEEFPCDSSNYQCFWKMEPEIIKLLRSKEGYDFIDQHFIAPYLEIKFESMNRVRYFQGTLGDSRYNFDIYKNANVYEVQKFNNSLGFYARSTSYMKLQNLYESFESMNKEQLALKSEVLMARLLDSQFESLKEQKAVSKWSNIVYVDNKDSARILKNFNELIKSKLQYETN